MSLPLDFGAGRIRQWSRKDRDALLRHADNPNVARYLSTRFPQPYTAADADAWFALIESTAEASQWAIEIDGEAVGGIGVRIGEAEFRRCGELGYWLSEACWGRGFATAAVRAVVPYAMRRFGLIRLQAYAVVENRASQRVLEKAGFVREGVARSRAVKGDRIEDHALYALVGTRVAGRARD